MMKVYTEIVIDIASGEIEKEVFFEYDGEVALCGHSASSNQVVIQKYDETLENHLHSLLGLLANQREIRLPADSDQARIWQPFYGFSRTELDGHASSYRTGFIQMRSLFDAFPTKTVFETFQEDIVGFDTDNVWNEAVGDIVTNTGQSLADDLSQAHSNLLTDDIKSNTLPGFETGMRDMNAVMTSTFIIGRALIWDGKTKALSKFDAEARMRVVPLVAEKWRTQLTWQKDVMLMYAELAKLFVAAEIETKDWNYKMFTKNILWPYNLYEYERVMLGTFEGSHRTTTSIEGDSAGARLISGAMNGVSMGLMAAAAIPKLSNPVGAAAGAVLGIVSTFL